MVLVGSSLTHDGLPNTPPHNKVFDIINRLQNFLQQISVKCILTGGFAVSIHSNLYQTTDIDIKICPGKDLTIFMIKSFIKNLIEI